MRRSDLRTNDSKLDVARYGPDCESVKALESLVLRASICSFDGTELLVYAVDLEQSEGSIAT